MASLHAPPFTLHFPLFTFFLLPSPFGEGLGVRPGLGVRLFLHFMSFELFIARRIYGDKTEGQRFSRPAVRIAMAGIAIGLIVMIISVAVVMGFKREVSGKVIGFGAHAQILSLTQDQNYVIYPVVTNDSLKDVVKHTHGVKHLQEFATIAGMLKTDDDFRGVQIKGIGEDYDTRFLERYLTEGTIPSFSSKQSSNNILISQRIANELQLKNEDKVFAYFFVNGNIRARRFIVKGIYETHLAEYDKAMCFTDIRTVRKLNGWEQDESSGLEITVQNFDLVDAVVSRLVERVNHTPDRVGAMRGAFSIRDIAPHIFAWLEVLDMNVMMILILMMAIGGFTVVSGLLIVMLERISMIGTLKALGATNMQVRRVFQHFAVMLVGKAIIIGDIVALAICFLQKHFNFIKLDADTYYIDSVPIELQWLPILLINLAVLLISSIVIFASSFLVSIKGPATTIRWE